MHAEPTLKRTVYPIRFVEEPDATTEAGLDGTIVADAIILRPVTQAPFACDASTKGAVIYNGEGGTSTNQRLCFCTDDGVWNQQSACGFAP